MYKSFFGFKKSPFKITPDPEFFFAGGNRGAVLEALLYAVARGEGIVTVVGEVGSGKTMLCRMLEHELPDDCEIVYLANPRLSPEEILHAITIELNLKLAGSASKVEVMRVLHDYLLDRHAHNKRVVMFVEEAQGMELDTLEEIRMLSNLETTQDKLLQIVLFGQPELNEKLGAHEIRQLRERITYAFDLAPLNRREIRDYLNSRIDASGYRGAPLFSNAAIGLLQRQSRGLLRRINILADKALLAAFSRGERRVTKAHLRLAAKDSEFSVAGAWTAWFFAAGALLLMVGLFFGVWSQQTPILETRATADPKAPAASAVTGHESAQAGTSIYDDLTTFADIFVEDRDTSSDSSAQASASSRPATTQLNEEFIDLDALQPDTAQKLNAAALLRRLESHP